MRAHKAADGVPRQREYKASRGRIAPVPAPRPAGGSGGKSGRFSGLHTNAAEVDRPERLFPQVFIVEGGRTGEGGGGRGWGRGEVST